MARKSNKQVKVAKKQLGEAAKSIKGVGRKAVVTAKATAKEVSKTRDAKRAKKQAKVA